MHKVELRLPELLFITATRGALGVGVGLLMADKLDRAQRHRLGRALLAVGVLSTMPAARLVFGRRMLTESA